MCPFFIFPALLAKFGTFITQKCRMQEYVLLLYKKVDNRSPYFPIRNSVNNLVFIREQCTPESMVLAATLSCGRHIYNVKELYILLNLCIFLHISIFPIAFFIIKSLFFFIIMIFMYAHVKNGL